MSINFKRFLSRQSNDKPSPADNGHFGSMGSFLLSLHERGFACKEILDIGANKGDWSKLAKKVFPFSNLYMIEPLVEMEKSLSEFCSVNEGSKYFLYGIGSRIEKRFMTTWGEELAGANFMVDENPHLKARNQQREIEIVTVDHLLAEGRLPVPDTVKIDVQGFELEVLKGSCSLFGKTELFIIECSLFEFSKGMPLLSDIILYMKDKEYEVYDIAGYLRRPYDNAIAQVDVCFARRSGELRASNAWINPGSGNVQKSAK